MKQESGKGTPNVLTQSPNKREVKLCVAVLICQANYLYNKGSFLGFIFLLINKASNLINLSLIN